MWTPVQRPGVSTVRTDKLKGQPRLLAPLRHADDFQFQGRLGAGEMNFQGRGFRHGGFQGLTSDNGNGLSFSVFAHGLVLLF
jgi:hypothetical protein